MNENFIRFLDGSQIAYTEERDMGSVCSLAYFFPADPHDTHPDYWELHPDGDEMLLVVSGELDVGYVPAEMTNQDQVPADAARCRVTVGLGESFIVRRGYWHRLLFKTRTDLIVAGHWTSSQLVPAR
ncbi:hypothetical protein C7T94_06220 [Pedobacter yulinensis]|uniref:Cupin n=1 Tax=Pedobacter yulinensis TaxID=2126353 RepID=A0A2T3HPD2_9SPHI|nr:hypothetical protein [Pedobacter yulinensis]PST84308.1 hypothetical protein C7T94_06220 [Pedobacter yulinensis]